MSDADLYRRSSQFRMWSFTREQLIQIRTRVNRRIPPSENTLAADEELALVQYYATDVLAQFCERFRLPSQVRAASITFFMRFYLQFSVMEWEPKQVLPTCVFLAAKSENWFIPIDRFVEEVDGIEKQQVLDLEFTLFKAMQFTLAVHSPIKPLHGFFLDMQGPIAADTNLGHVHDSARSLVVSSLASDAQFLYTPSQIALAALMDVNEDLVVEYLAQQMDGPNTSLDRLLNIVRNCRDELRRPLAEKEVRKAANKRLKAYRKQISEEDEAPRKRPRTD